MSSSRSRRKTASTASHVEAQQALYAAPWLLAVLIAVMGQALYAMWGNTPWQWLAQAGMTLAVGCVAYAGFLNTKSRSGLALGHTVITIILTGIWLILCTGTGWINLEYVDWAKWRVPILQRPTFDLYILGTVVLCVMWNMRQGIHAREAKDAALQGDTMDEWGEAGVPGIRGYLRKKNDFFLEGTLILPRGMTIRDVQSHSERIESAKDWPSKSLTVLPRPGVMTARRITARVMLKDPLLTAVSWPGVKLKPKQTLFDPIPTGRRADGEESSVFVAKKEGSKHFLIQGMSGAGKTLGQNPILLYTAALGAINFVFDTRKGIQSFGPIAPALHWLITDEGVAKAALKRIAEVVIPARTKQLAREGLPQWSPKASMPLLRLQIEEAWDLIDSEYLDEIAKTARSAAIQLVVSLQRASHTEMSTVVREQLGTRFCYGLGGSFGAMILDDEVLDAGADPTKWKDEQPGMHYLTRGDLSISEKATPTRSYNDDGSITFAHAAIQIGPTLVEVDTITKDALGILWTKRISPVDLVKQIKAEASPVSSEPSTVVPAAPAAPVHPATQVVIPPQRTAPDPAGQHDVVELSEDEVRVITTMSEDGKTMTFSGDGLPDEHFVFTDEDLEPTIDIDMDTPIVDRPADRPLLILGDQSKEKASPEQLAKMMEARLTELIDSGQKLLSSSDFKDVVIESGCARTMVYKFRDKWDHEGRIHVEEGVGWLVMSPSAQSSE